MNTVLSTIAGVIILVLIAALVGPTFVDWNRFRADIETQASKLTGRAVRIGGDIQFVMLPAPHMTVDDVSISNIPGTENSDFARIGQVDAEVALAPLIRGDISVTSVKVIRPQVHLEVLADGSNNWKSLADNSRVPLNGVFSLSSIRLDQAHVEEGTLTFSNHANNRSWRLNHVSGDVIAESLLGPVRGELAFEASSTPFALRFALGSFSDGKSFPVTANLESNNAEAKLLFSGLATGFSVDSRIDGTTSLELGNTQSKQGGKQQFPVRLEGTLAMEGRKADFRNVVVAMSGTTLKGSAHADWRARPSLDVKLKGEALTLDPTLDRFFEVSEDGKIPFSGLAGIPLPDGVDISATMSVDGLLVRNILIKNAGFSSGLKDGVLNVQYLRGEIAGGTGFELSGVLATRDEGRSFDGQVSATSRNLVTLAQLLASLRAEPNASKPVVAAALSRAPRRPFSIFSHFQLTPDSIEFPDIAAAYAVSPQPAELKGSFGIILPDDVPTAKPIITANFQAKSFDLDPLLALWPAEDMAPQVFLTDYDTDLTIAAEKLVVAEQSVKGLDAALSLSQDTLTVQRFNASELAGGQLALSGTLNGISKADINALSGTLHGTLVAADTTELRKLAKIESDGLGGPLNLTIDAASSDDQVGRSDKLTISGKIADSRIDAVLTRSSTTDGKVVRTEFVANAANPDGAKLLAQLGLHSSTEKRNSNMHDAANASLQFAGVPGKPYDATFRFNAAGGTFTAKGDLSDPFTAATFNGHVDVTASDAQNVLAALGVSDRIADFSLAQANGPGFVFSSDLEANNYLLDFSSLELVAGNLHIEGNVTYTDAVDGKLPQLDGTLEANRLDLAPIFASAKQDTLPAEALEWSPLLGFEGNLVIKTNVLALGSVQLEKANIPLALAGGVLTASPVKAAFAGGEATLTARFTSNDSGEQGMGLTVALQGSDLAAAGPQLFGANFASGRTTVSGQFEGQGRSWLALLASLTGTGSIATQNATFTSLDVSGFSDGLTKMKSFAEFAPLTQKVLPISETPVGNLEGSFAMRDGVATFSHDALALKGGTGKLSASYDLPRRDAEAKLIVTLSKPEGAPPFTVSANTKQGSVARRMDVAALSQFISTQVLAQTASDAGVSSIPKALQDLMGLSYTPKKKETGAAVANLPLDAAPSIAGIPMPVSRPEALTRQSLR